MLTKITVRPTDRVLEQRVGHPSRVLAPGRHRRTWRARYLRVDVRERLLTLSPQEVLTQDGVSLRATVSLRWRVVDPVAYVEVSEDATAVVYLAAQLALRDALAEHDAVDVVRLPRGPLAERLTTLVDAAATPVGITVTEAVVRDLLLPSELRSALAEALVVRQRGQARLEAARAESAALRSLANAAKLLDDHPALARIKLVEALPPGAQVHLDRQV